jgi:hypothetical protein
MNMVERLYITMAETDTKHLILQAIRELEIEDVEVKASTSNPGFYDVTTTETIASVPMDCPYKTIVGVLKHAVASQSIKD